MRLELTINIDNDAFNAEDYGWQSETIRCLKKVIDQIADQNRTYGGIVDSNGNKVGEWDINNEDQGETK